LLSGHLLGSALSSSLFCSSHLNRNIISAASSHFTPPIPYNYNP
jgi:hypothetical protein